jgi:hypothetical protein
MSENKHHWKIVAAISVCLVLSLFTPWTRVIGSTAAVADTPEMLRIKSEAAAFSNAIRQISNLPLSTERDLRQAVEVLKKNDAVLRSNYFSRMVRIALDNPAFSRAIESKLAKTSAKELSLQLQRNREAVREFPGARQAEQEILKQLRSDAAALERVGKRLQEASRSRKAGLSEAPPAPTAMFV